MAEYFVKDDVLTPQIVEEKSKRYEMPFELEEKMLTHFNELLIEKGMHVLGSANAECLATAMAYLHRFYLHESVFAYDPQQFVYAMLFLSIKVHEIDLPHQQFCQHFAIDPRKINLARLEQVLLAGLNF